MQHGLPGMAPDPDKALSQWFTDRRLARSIIAWSLESFKIPRSGLFLEPSAGGGSFVDGFVQLGASDRLHALELSPPWVGHLRSQYPQVRVIESNFLKYEAPLERFDLAVMNPPFEEDQDLDHIEHALGMSRCVTALVRVNFLTGVKRYKRLWRRTHLHGIRYLVDRPHFSGAGSPRHDFVVIRMADYPATSVDFGWWNSLGGTP